MKITVASIENIDEIIQIENSSFTDPWSRNSIEEAINSENITVFTVIDDGGNVVGFSCLLIIDYEAEILNIAVSEKFRSNGIGISLARHMIDVCSAKEVEDIFLEVRSSNAPAKALYRKCGFTELGIRKKYYSNPTEDAVLMKLSL